MIRIRSVTPLEQFQARLIFTDDSEKVVDLAPYLRGPIFESLKRDPALFGAVHVDEQLGTVVWPNGADIDPDVLYWGRVPAAWEQASATAGQGE
jgi:hypothetical protein